jgi:hypothetical protein
MQRPETDILQIPMQITRYVFHNDLVKPFAIFLYLKFFTSGKFHQDTTYLTEAGNYLGIKDKRTFKTHFRRLLDLNWIGFNPKTGYYFIRSFDRIRAENGFKSRQAVTLWHYNLKKLHSFIVGAILSAEINRQRYASHKESKRRTRPAVLKRDAASPARNAKKGVLDYFGLGLEAICKLLNWKKTRASQLRAMAAKDGFIQVKHQFQDWNEISERDFHMRNYLKDVNPHIARRLRFKKVASKTNPRIKVMLQLHDEIIPKVQFKTVNKFNRLAVPQQIKAAILSRMNIHVQKAA